MVEVFAIQANVEAPLETLGAFADLVEQTFNDGVWEATHNEEVNPYILLIGVSAKLGMVAQDMVDIAGVVNEDELTTHADKIQHNLRLLAAYVAMIQYKIGATPHGNTEQTETLDPTASEQGTE